MQDVVPGAFLDQFSESREHDAKALKVKDEPLAVQTRDVGR